MMQCLFVLFDELILGFCYSDLTLEAGRFELASSNTLVLQANQLTKCASQREVNSLLESVGLMYLRITLVQYFFFYNNVVRKIQMIFTTNKNQKE